MTEGTTQPLEGLTVLELSTSHPGAQIGQFLADFGADVVLVEPPGGSRLRSQPAFPAWARGKRSIELDLADPGSRPGFERLLARCDVLVETFRPATRQRFGLDPAATSGLNPRLIHASITGFGSEGPLADLKGYEALVMAKVGGLSAFSGMLDRSGPAFVSAPFASWAVSQAGLHGILAALYERESSGAGQHVESSLAASVGSLDPWGWMVRWLTLQYPDAFQAAPPVGDNLVPNSSFTYRLLVALTADGRWLQFSQVQPRLFRALMRSLDLEWMFDDPKWKSVPEFDDAEQRVELWETMLEQARAKTVAEWQEAFSADHDVWAEVFRRGSELLHHPQLVHNGMVAELPDRDGVLVRQPGRLVKVLDGVESWDPRPAPSAGQDGDALESIARREQPAGPLSAPTEQSLPLSGVTVLELGTFYAAPFGATLLTDLGARVIKVEPLEGDPMRTILPFPESGAARVLQGKESVAVDMASDSGRQIIHELARRSDLVLQCFRAGVAERLGIDSASLKAINPDLVYLNAPGYGVDGPNGHCPAFAPTMGAGAGFAWRNVGSAVADGPGLDILSIRRNALRLTAAAGPQFAQADGVSAVAVATGLLVGLVGRARGAGSPVLMTTMVSSCAHALSDDMVEYPGREPVPVPDPEFFGFGPLYRLYEASEGWVFLAAPKVEEWAALSAAMAGWASGLDDERFADPEGRQRYSDDLSALLAATFSTRKAAEWEADLVAAGVGCVEVAPAPPEGNYLGEFGRANGYVAEVEHPVFGLYPRLAPLVHFSRSSVTALPGSVLGQHTAPVLEELGYDQEGIDGLRQSGVILTA